jgi:hypothetical protein
MVYEWGAKVTRVSVNFVRVLYVLHFHKNI